MEYSKIETEIANYLNAYFATVTVVDGTGQTVLFSTQVKAQEIAQDEKEANRPFKTSLVSVMFWKTTPQDTSSLNVVVQEETHILKLIFQSRNLRSTFGMYAVIDQTKKAIIGYRPEQSTTRIIADAGPELKEYENNAQQYEMTVKFNALSTQAFDDDEQSDILLTRVTYNEEIHIPGEPALS